MIIIKKARELLNNKVGFAETQVSSYNVILEALLTIYCLWNHPFHINFWNVLEMPTKTFCNVLYIGWYSCI